MHLNKYRACLLFKEPTNQNLLYIATLSLLLITGPIILLGEVSWHDQQRIIQILTSIISCIFLILNNRKSQISLQSQKIILLIVLLGVASTTCSKYPTWGFLEIANAISCLSIFMASKIALQDNRSYKLLLLSIVIICIIKTIQFYSAYVAAIVQGYDLDPLVLLDGFSNPRFFGQFQTITIPLIAYFLVSDSYGKKIKILAFLLLVAWWTISLAGGTRATWLAIATCIAIMLFFGKKGRSWSYWQCSSLLLSIFIYMLLFKAVPIFYGIEPGATRITASLSLRDILWKQAIQVIINHPLLGIGPMQLASLSNGIAAHPHQIILQIAAEWGLPTLVTAILLTCIYLKKISLITKKSDDPIIFCAYPTIIAIIIQAQIDGILAMPYPQTLIPCLLAIFYQKKPVHHQHHSVNFFILLLIPLSVIILIIKTHTDINSLNWHDIDNRYNAPGNLKPRFWNQGLIN